MLTSQRIILVTFYGLSLPLGVCPLRKDFSFSPLLYLYSVAIGLPLIAYKIRETFNWAVPDLLIWGSFFLTQLVGSINLLVYLAIAPRVHKQLASCLKEVKSAAPDVIPFPWMIFFPPIFKIIVTLLYFSLGIKNWNTAMNATVLTFIMEAPTSILPLQFALFNHFLESAIVHHTATVAPYSINIEGTVLLEHYKLLRLFERANRLYSPFILMMFIMVFVIIPPYTQVAVKNQNLGTFRFIVISEIIFTFLAGFVVINSCENLKKQVTLFNKKIFILARSYQYIMNNEKVTLFIEYQPQIKPKFYTFSIQYRILTNLIEFCVTYTMMLLQYGKNNTDNSRGNNTSTKN